MYYLTKGKSKIKFDIVMNVGESVLYGTILKAKVDEIAAAAMQKPKTNKPMSILEARFKLGHTGGGCTEDSESMWIGVKTAEPTTMRKLCDSKSKAKIGTLYFRRQKGN